MRGGDRDAPAYFTIRLVLPIWLSPTIPTLSVMLQCAPQHAWYVSKHAASREERDREQGRGGADAHVLSIHRVRRACRSNTRPFTKRVPPARSLQAQARFPPKHAKDAVALSRPPALSSPRSLCPPCNLLLKNTYLACLSPPPPPPALLAPPSSCRSSSASIPRLEVATYKEETNAGLKWSAKAAEFNRALDGAAA